MTIAGQKEERVHGELVDCLQTPRLVVGDNQKFRRAGNSHLANPAGRKVRGKSMGTKLYVGNLSFETPESDLSDLFGQVGNVTSCSLITDRDTGKSRGFAFVEMSTDEEAQKAIAELNGKDVGGRALKVNEAKPREDRPRRDFGGGGGGGGGGRSRY